MELYDLLEAVHDQQSFLLFARALLKERYDDTELEKKHHSDPLGPTHKGWANTTLEGFLEAALAWADASDFGAYQNIKDNAWYKFAVFLYCGKIYE